MPINSLAKVEENDIHCCLLFHKSNPVSLENNHIGPVPFILDESMLTPPSHILFKRSKTCSMKTNYSFPSDHGEEDWSVFLMFFKISDNLFFSRCWGYLISRTIEKLYKVVSIGYEPCSLSTLWLTNKPLPWKEVGKHDVPKSSWNDAWCD